MHFEPHQAHIDRSRFSLPTPDYAPATHGAPATPIAGEVRSSPFAISRGELALIAAFWVFLAVLTAANAALDPRGRGPAAGLTWMPVGMAFLQYAIWALLTPLLFWVASRYSLDHPDRLKRLALFLVLGVIIAIGVELLLSAVRLELIAERMRRGPFGRRGPLFGLRRMFWLDDLTVFIGVMAAGTARDYFRRYQARREETATLQAQAARLQAQLAEAHLTALRSQLDPHFLFNTLHAISSLVERDPRGVRRMIARLSELLRSTLEGAQEQEVTVETEMAFLQRYLEIMEIRHQGRLTVELDIHPDVLPALVPTLILQPLVENAVRHGVSQVEGMGQIAVAARRDGEQLILEVRDNGPGPDANTRAQEGVGLRNTRERLAQLYGPSQSLALSAVAGGGAVARVVLPFHTHGDLRATAVAPTA